MSCPQEKMNPKDMNLKLMVEGEEVPMVDFVHDSFRDMIVAFVNNLKGHDGGKIEITIEK